MAEPMRTSWGKSLDEAVAKWRRRNRAEKRLIVEALILLGLARIGLLLLPFRVLARSIGNPVKEEHQTSPPPADLKSARMIGEAVRAAAKYTPWESVCLPQAVAAKWMLKRRDIPGVLYLGVMKDHTKPEKLAAHAWIKSGNVILTGAKGHRQYTVVSRFL